MKKILLALFLAIFLGGTSFAYQVGFTTQGDGIFDEGTTNYTNDYYDQLTFAGTDSAP